MDITSKRAQGKLMSFKSTNDKIDVLITDATNGPIVVLEDDSVVQFTDILQYYHVMIDPKIYDVFDQTFDIDKFKEKYLEATDDVDRLDISGVEKYVINDKDSYRYIMG